MTSKILTAGKFTAYQKIILAILALLQFIVILDFMIISPIGYILTKDLDITTNQFGLIVSSYIFSAAASGIISAGFIDKFDRKNVLLFFFTGFIIGTLFCALSNSFISLLTARIITGIFGGVIGSITMTIVTDLFTPNQRGRAMTTIQMAFAASQIIGIPIGLFIANNLGWHYTFFLIVILSVLILLVILLKLNPVNEHLKVNGKNPFFHFWDLAKNKQHQIGFSATIFLGMGMMLQPFISIFLVNNIHITNDQVPIIFMVTGASAFFVMPFVGKLSDKFDKFKIFLIGSIATIVIIPLYTHLPIVPLWVVLVMNVIMFAAIMSRMGPFQALNSMIPEPSARGGYMSISSSLQQMAGGLGITIAGSIVYQPTPNSPLQNFDWLGYVAVSLSVVAAYLVYKVSKIVKHNRL
ncbi:major facilitator superfamily MFS permease [Sporocytophaga myxococcoides]|uniref:Major facilitator superfamily MFS permease n=1 Tax=Sporocytophaga myxococcoides TaxID=153721 RepID=A0A098LL88_9BACT|nr:MFS transporter [Sporocytophaga myxococcoides]GAL86883.1 major facilitator superfamily MFS permease [Sporocytophaga myxococcoides]